jgi:hypothetical protein
MQDLSTGEMRDLTPFLKGVPTLPPGESIAKFMAASAALDAALQKAKDEVQPDRSKQGPVFAVGEVLEIRGGRFQVTKIEPGHLKLKSLPAV